MFFLQSPFSVADGVLLSVHAGSVLVLDALEDQLTGQNHLGNVEVVVFVVEFDQNGDFMEGLEFPSEDLDDLEIIPFV